MAPFHFSFPKRHAPCLTGYPCQWPIVDPSPLRLPFCVHCACLSSSARPAPVDSKTLHQPTLRSVCCISFGYDSLGLCAGQTPKFVNTFNLQPHNQWRPTGSHSRSLARCRRFHPSVRACNTCRKTRAEVYKALGFPRGRLSQASVQYFRSCKLLSLGTWSSCSLSSGSYELVTECLNSLPRNLGKRGRSEEGPPAPPAAEPGLYT